MDAGQPVGPRAQSPAAVTARGIFITGTDTGVGKTRVACALLRELATAGRRCAAFKPVAAGAVPTAQGPRNEDALALNEAASVKLPYERVNPVCLPAALAPHIAAAQSGRELTRAALLSDYQWLAGQAEWLVIEGAGGWLVPLNARETMGDLAAAAGWDVVLVTGMRLGCLNHALLSAASIVRTNRLIGWIANELPPAQPALADNVAALEHWLPAPRLARLRPHAGALEWTPAGRSALGF